MPLTILNQLQGVSTNHNPYTTVQPLPCRYDLCHTLGTSLFASDMGSSKLHSDDQAIGGVNRAGYPFLLLIDGFFGCDRQAVFAFVELEILPLLEPYTAQLTSNPKGHHTYTQALIKLIVAHKRAFLNKGIDFTLSLAVTFAFDNGLYTAGFGVGDIGMVLRKKTGRIVQLTYHTVVDGFKDGFDDYIVNHSQKVDEVIQRSSQFLVPVEPGDELLAYTYLPASLETENTVPSEQTGIKRLMLAEQFFPVKPKLSLLTQLWEKVRSEHQQQLTKQQATEASYKFGDDAMFIAIQIPTDNQRHSILLANFIHELQVYEKRLQESTTLTKNHQPFWHWLNGNQTSFEQKILTHVLAILNGEPKTALLTKDEIKRLEKTELGQIIAAYRAYGIHLEHLHDRLQQLYTHSPLLWPDTLAQVMSYLPIPDIVQAGMTCRFFQHISQETLQKHYYPKPTKWELASEIRNFMRVATVNPTCIAIGCTKGILELWDVAENKRIKTHAINSPIWSITATNKRWVVVISRGNAVNLPMTLSFKGPYALTVWDIEQNQSRILLQAEDKITLINDAPNGKAMVATEQAVMLWDLATGHCEQKWPMTLPIDPIFYPPHAKVPYKMINAQELIGAKGHHIMLWNLITGESKSWPAHTNNSVSTLVAINEYTCASTAGDGLIKIWDTQTAHCLTSLSHGETITAMTLFGTDHLLSAGGHANKTIKIWNLATGICVETLSFYGYTYAFATINPQQFVSLDFFSMAESISANLWTFSSRPQHSLTVAHNFK